MLSLTKTETKSGRVSMRQMAYSYAAARGCLIAVGMLLLACPFLAQGLGSSSILVDSAGELLLVDTNSSGNIYATKYSTSGGQVYSNYLGSGLKFSSILVDSAGELLLVDTNSSGNIYATKYSTSGGQVYSNYLGSGLKFSSILVDSAGELLLVDTNSSGNIYA